MKITRYSEPQIFAFLRQEVAQELGARYAEGGWYAPPGVDLTELKSRGWL